MTNTTKSVVDRELEEDRNSVLRSRRASAARSAAGRPRKKINGSVLVGTSGTALTPEASARLAFTSGLKRNASRAADGRHIPSGTPIRENDDLSNECREAVLN